MLPRTTYSVTLANRPEYYVHRSGEKQAKPYNLMCKMTNYDHRSRVISRVGSQNPPDVNSTLAISMFNQIPSGMQARVENTSYKKLVNQLGDASSLGATLTAERRETWGMVTGSIMRCLSAARNIRKLKFGAAARDLGIPYHERTVVRRVRERRSGKRDRIRKVREKQFSWKGGKYYAKTLGSGWLMYSYGVKPLVQDIYNGIDILQREFPFTRIHGYAKESATVRHPDRWQPNNIFDIVTTTIAVKQSVGVRVINPNLWRANQLGLVNPLHWFVEGIPFSFIVDWFSNLSDVVMSFTDFVGLEQENPCVNMRRTQYRMCYAWYASYDNLQYEVVLDQRFRSLSLVPPKLRFAYERFQWQRGANAISLLVQALKT